MQSDHELLLEIRQGNQPAMEVLVNRYYKTLFSYIYRSMGDYHASYDLTQEVFIKMIKSLDKFEDREGTFKNWIFKITVNTIRDYIKSLSYRNMKNTGEVDEMVPDSSQDVIDFVSLKLQSYKIREAVMELPDYQREAIILRYFHDMKISDIADITETNESTVKSRLRQGAEKLKLALKGGGSFEDREQGI